MELQEVVLDKEVFHEELRNQKLKVAKMEELQPRDTGDLSRTRPWFMPRMLKPEMQLRNIKGCHERFHVNKDDLAKELEKDKHDGKEPSET